MKTPIDPAAITALAAETGISEVLLKEALGIVEPCRAATIHAAYCELQNLPESSRAKALAHQRLDELALQAVRNARSPQQIILAVSYGPARGRARQAGMRKAGALSLAKVRKARSISQLRRALLDNISSEACELALRKWSRLFLREVAAARTSAQLRRVLANDAPLYRRERTIVRIRRGHLLRSSGKKAGPRRHLRAPLDVGRQQPPAAGI